MRYLIFIFFIPFFFIYPQNNSYKIEGKVIDASTLEPIVQANVLVEGTINGAATNLNGYFNLVLPFDHHTIKISAVGYEPQSLTLICLNDNDKNVNTIVVGLKQTPIIDCFIINYDVDSVSAKGRFDAVSDIQSGVYRLIQKFQITQLQEYYSSKYAFSFIIDTRNLREYRMSYNEIVLIALLHKFGNEILQTLKSLDWENN